MSKTYYWLFTSFNQVFLENHQAIMEELITKEELKYCIYQVEECPVTKRRHLQGYFVFNKRKRIDTIKKLLGDNTIHLEKRRGSHLDAKKYCSKDESRIDGPFEYGCDQDLIKSKKRKIDEVKDLIKSGASEFDVANEFFGLWCRYYKAFATFRMLVSQPRDFKTIVRCYWGKAGVGKSRRASYEAGPNAYRKPRGEWWDGYDGESNVIFDDFYGWIKLDELLRICDRYAHRVPVKGGYVNFRPKIIIFTSNVEPLKWYSEDVLNGDIRDAFLRRFDVIEEMTDPWVEPEESVNNAEINNN